MITSTKQIVDRFSHLPEAERRAIVADALAVTAHMRWLPNPGPQTEAYFSPADILLYGGEAGGSKSDLLLGLAFNQHKHSLLVRRQYTDLGALCGRAIQINGTRKGFSGAIPPRLVATDGRIIEFFACSELGSEQHRQGQPVSFLGVDEGAQLAWSQIKTLMGWLRSVDASERCRTVIATNPPLTSEGQWLTEEFAPWLDETHPNPAKPGELRWTVSDEDGRTKWVDGPEPVEIGGKMVRSESRTFIPAGLRDNPFLSRTDYARRLDNLEEPLRSAVRDGNFQAARRDDPGSLFPLAWIQAPQARWQPLPPPGVPMSAIAVDVAAGGPDETVLAPRYDGYYPDLIVVPGKETPDGSSAAALVIQYRRDNCEIIVDAGGGFGLSAIERLKENGFEVAKFLGAAKSAGRTNDGREPFANVRSEAHWRFREALNPDQPGGTPIALPPDPKLVSQLSAIRYTIGSHGVELEAKELLIKKLGGKSPDRSDAVVMAWFRGLTGSHQRVMWGQSPGGYGKPLPQAIRSHENRRRFLRR